MIVSGRNSYNGTGKEVLHMNKKTFACIILSLVFATCFGCNIYARTTADSTESDDVIKTGSVLRTEDF